LLLGCGSKGAESPSAQSPEQQSEAQYALARELFSKGESRAALDHVRKAVDLNGDNAKALHFASLVHLSFCAGDKGLASPDCKLSEAESYARRALKADEGLRDARNTLGVVLTHEKRYAEAIETLEPLTKDPAYVANFMAWGNLGWAQVLSGRVDDGIASLKNAVTQPRFCVGYYRLGMAYEKKGDLKGAEQSLTQALSVESPDCQNLQDAWEARARVRMKLGDGTKARADWERCREISAGSSTGEICSQALGANVSPGGPAVGSPRQ
jgi:Tfp pilus assembly protein PilF